MAQTLILRSTVDPEFTIEVDDRVIKSCSVLKNLQDVTKDKGEVPVEMSQRQLGKFVEFHNHFASVDDEKDLEYTNAFFEKIPEAELKDLCFKADFLDSQRFLEAVGDFLLHKFENAEVDEIRRYLNVVNDYTPEERQALEDHPLEFFTGISIQNNADDVAAGPSTSQQAPEN
uniref:SKP1 component dimerisation domain-containing protein n=1 Tax=Panagrolaimus sp. PS1159 TaxID=55785 RepID=A0AC35F3K7_9BILA